MPSTRTLVQTIMVIVICCASVCGSADGESTSAPAPSSTVTAPSPDDVPRSDLKNPRPLDWFKAEVVDENQIRVHYLSGDPKCVGINAVVEENEKEIVGLRLGKDLEYALPSELAFMADPETSVLFDLKFLESKLVCFDLQGVVYQGEKADIEVEAESEDEEKLGPMILCVDTSGSMNGTPENIAKAMVLYAGNKAIAQGRKCFVINFSTGIELLDLSESRSVTDLISFLKKSFHGGTDAAPALRHALKMIQDGGYEKADVLMISDFVMGELPDTLLQDIKRQRDSGNKFNSLVIGDAFMHNRLKTHFDHEWIYNYNSHTIQELVKFGQDVQRG